VITHTSAVLEFELEAVLVTFQLNSEPCYRTSTELWSPTTKTL